MEESEPRRFKIVQEHTEFYILIIKVTQGQKRWELTADDRKCGKLNTEVQF